MTPEFTRKVEEATRGLLSSMRSDLLTVGAACELAGLLPKHFAQPAASIYRALLDTWRESKPYDGIALAAKLRSDGIDTQAARDLLYEPTSAAMAPTYIKLLLECHAARALHAIGQSLVADAFNMSLPAGETLESARKAVLALTVEPIVEDTRLQTHLHGALESLMGTQSEMNATSVHLGLGLDDLAGPFYRGDLIVLGAETKKGKSAIAGNIVESVAGRGHRAAIFSLEMTVRQIAERMIASQASVNVRAFKLRKQREVRQSGPLFVDDVEAEESRRMTTAVNRMEDWRVEVIPETFRLSQIVSRMVQLKASGGLDLAVVDYAQLVEGMRHEGDNREREVASISRTLKRAAAQTDSVVLLLSQLNEEGRLRESRAIGQDANCVLFLEGDKERVIRVGAARSAPSGAEMVVEWKSEFTRFRAA